MSNERNRKMKYKCHDCYWVDNCPDADPQNKACGFFTEEEPVSISEEDIDDYITVLRYRQEMYDKMIEELNDKRIQDRKERYGE